MIGKFSADTAAARGCLQALSTPINTGSLIRPMELPDGPVPGASMKEFAGGAILTLWNVKHAIVVQLMLYFCG